MLAVKTPLNKISLEADYKPRAANDQQPVEAAVTVETAGMAASLVAAETTTAAQKDAPWLQDWSRAWSSMANSMTNSMMDASSASIGAIGSMAMATAKTLPAVTEPKPASEISLWANPASVSRPRSWYRPPTPNLLDPTAWGLPAPFAVYGVPVSAAAMGFPAAMGFGGPSAFGPTFGTFGAPLGMASWFGLGQNFGQNYGSNFGQNFGMPSYQPSPFANPFIRAENPMTAWLSNFAAPQRPTNPWADLTNAMTNTLSPSPFSSYRSDSGYAVAQISMAEPKPAASTATDAAMAFWNLFAWPSPAKAH